jgi:RNA polymerase sigma-70 factor (ECF subfamily)
LRVAHGPVVLLNHAAAVAMAQGPDAGLALLDELAAQPALQGYHLYYAARADLLRRVGRTREAIPEYERALQLVRNEPERRYLTERIARLQGSET